MKVPSLLVNCAIVALFSFAGGFAAQTMFGGSASHAQGFSVLPADNSPAAQQAQAQPPVRATPEAQAYRSNFSAITDGKNRKGIQTYINDGQPGQIFYGENGLIRLQMGTYDGGKNNVTGERGMPLLGLSDNRGRLRLLFRLAGENESPVMVMKDTSGRDRVVFGLHPSQPTQEPFMRIYDNNLKSREILLDVKN
ncbi:MAG: hypothetical protein ACAH80_11845 [Alphaproteobacteria bacterium]